MNLHCVIRLLGALFGMFAPVREHAQKPHFYVIVSPASFSFNQAVEYFLHFRFEVIEQVALSRLGLFSHPVTM